MRRRSVIYDCHVPNGIDAGDELAVVRPHRMLLADVRRVGQVGRHYVGGVERGERNISLINIIELAHALSVKPGDLLKRIV